MAHATKQLLSNSLKKLLTKKTLDKITVTELAEDCKVNRQTFYYNFSGHLRSAGLDIGTGTPAIIKQRCFRRRYSKKLGHPARLSKNK